MNETLWPLDTAPNFHCRALKWPPTLGTDGEGCLLIYCRSSLQTNAATLSADSHQVFVFRIGFRRQHSHSNYCIKKSTSLQGASIQQPMFYSAIRSTLSLANERTSFRFSRGSEPLTRISIAERASRQSASPQPPDELCLLGPAYSQTCLPALAWELSPRSWPESCRP